MRFRQQNTAPDNRCGFFVNQSLDSINSNLDKLDTKLLPKTVDFNCAIVANQQGGWMTFSFLPLHRADLYNIEFTNQYLIGTGPVGLFAAHRFNLTVGKNGISIYSNDRDIVSWFQSGKLYMFTGTATLK